ncbi:hypothetical protein L21SP4_00096 [Kiritimatiella glycovorans]|uniref:DUF58 domain-containing protein n=2 Tax=Kiritimatiella glycovorans TaxID=1307763 RepID=A0A0G3EDD4_9BACT|nr:hypothetical protein L21SP4_00096 [Kiritimatiella glycovorans]
MPEAAYTYLPPSYAERLKTMGLSVRKPVMGTLQGLHRSPHLGSSVEFAEYREYVRGDPIRLIDWAVYARSDRYVIRRFIEETNLRACFLLDTSASMGYRARGDYTKLEYASYLAAGLMYVLINQGDSAGLMTFDSGVNRYFEPVGAFERLRPMLLHLEDLDPAGESGIEAIMHEAAERLPPKGLVIVLSDLLEDPDSILRGLRHLQHFGHDITVFHVLDGGELRLPVHGNAEFREMESGERLTVDTEEIREAYTREVERYLDRLQRGCTEGVADYVFADTSRSVFDVLRRRATQP